MSPPPLPGSSWPNVPKEEWDETTELSLFFCYGFKITFFFLSFWWIIKLFWVIVLAAPIAASWAYASSTIIYQKISYSFLLCVCFVAIVIANSWANASSTIIYQKIFISAVYVLCCHCYSSAFMHFRYGWNLLNIDLISQLEQTVFL